MFLPRAELATTVPSVDRVMVPGSDAASEGWTSATRHLRGVDVVYLHAADGFPFDGALVDIARTYDAATARWVAKSLQYPKVPLDSTSYRVWPWSLTFRPLAVGVLAMGAALGLVHPAPGPTSPGHLGSSQSDRRLISMGSEWDNDVDAISWENEVAKPSDAAAAGRFRLGDRASLAWGSGRCGSPARCRSMVASPVIEPRP